VVCDSGGSDHCAVVADLRIEGGEAGKSAALDRGSGREPEAAK
jgi:hypothetical protein